MNTSAYTLAIKHIELLVCSPKDFSANAALLVKKGWVPQGGVAVLPPSVEQGVMVHQLFVKYEDEANQILQGSSSSVKSRDSSSQIAFWSYDQFPYVKWGRISRFIATPDSVKVELEDSPGVTVEPFAVQKESECVDYVKALVALTQKRQLDLTQLSLYFDRELKELVRNYRQFIPHFEPKIR
jgi:hypothetical protein